MINKKYESKAIEILRQYSKDEEPPTSISKEEFNKWRENWSACMMENAMIQAGLIDEYKISSNVSIKRISYKGYMEMSRLYEELGRHSLLGWLKKATGYFVTAVISSALAVATAWITKKLGL